jgi:ABC-2 type transport system permease protein
MSSADVLDRPVARHRGVWRRQLGSELGLVFRRRRNVALLLLLSLVPLLIGIAVHVSAPEGGEGPPFLGLVAGNGLFLVFTALSVCLPVLLPLGVAIVAGDAVAGEASAGTLRYLLTVPVPRARLLLVKAAGIVAYCAAAVLAVALVGLAAGAVLFGLHDMTLLSGDTVSLGNGLLRALAVAGYVLVDLIGLAAVALFFSTLTEVPVGATGATVAFAIASAVLESVPQLGHARSLLLTHHWLDFAGVVSNSVPPSQVLTGLVGPLCYAAVFGLAAWARFTTADVTA